MLLIYSVGKFIKGVGWVSGFRFQVSSFKFQVSGCRLNCVKRQPAAQEIPNLRNDSSRCEGNTLYEVFVYFDWKSFYTIYMCVCFRLCGILHRAAPSLFDMDCVE